MELTSKWLRIIGSQFYVIPILIELVMRIVKYVGILQMKEKQTFAVRKEKQSRLVLFYVLKK